MIAPLSLHFGTVTVELHEGFTVTRFADGNEVHGLHSEQPGQAQTAAQLGMTVHEMNLSHDLLHSMLCCMLGLSCSPALRRLIDGEPESELHGAEEDAVLAVQRFMALAGVQFLGRQKEAA